MASENSDGKSSVFIEETCSNIGTRASSIHEKLLFGHMTDENVRLLVCFPAR